MFSNLKLLISHFIKLTEEESNKLETYFEYRKVSKKTILCKEGEIAKEIYFVNKGLLRLLYNNDGTEITAFLYTENLFASSYASFLEQKPSLQILETLEDSELLVLNFANLEKLYLDIPKFNILTRKVTEQRFINAQKILASHLTEKPEQRYHNFVRKHHDLMQRVPQHIIASFLGITAVSMSRIRNRK